MSLVEVVPFGTSECMGRGVCSEEVETCRRCFGLHVKGLLLQLIAIFQRCNHVCCAFCGARYDTSWREEVETRKR